MRTDCFDYELPVELIAQDPLPDRSTSRLLVVDRVTSGLAHHAFTDLPSLLREGDCMVVNTSRVLPARLQGRKEGTGGAVELLLLERTGPAAGVTGAASMRWKAMAGGASLRPGVRLELGESLEATVLCGPSEGIVEVELISPGGDVGRAIRERGRVPLPPYITHELADAERYQTVYSEREISAAAPTAGLHFTNALLESIEGAGVVIARLELAVGADTFVPVRQERVQDHRMHSEWYRLAPECALKVNATRRAGGRVIAVGTTSVRVLETSAGDDGTVRPGEGHTDLFITPGYRFKTVDGVVTNFHFPRSTLLMLVCAFGGTGLVLDAYNAAVRERYRFYSFGDAMLLL
jgi:S-adenosylmethionine:tRNA ribosyltransferase-isomerase